ncbi:MAG: hypothetical protein IJ019_04915, partial [Alphaproteobacteria bacterium]|nr:hypothetical protein [Alphaproteobacteria bacterium]
ESNSQHETIANVGGISIKPKVKYNIFLNLIILNSFLPDCIKINIKGNTKVLPFIFKYHLFL